jgi:hypothetical protein
MTTAKCSTIVACESMITMCLDVAGKLSIPVERLFQMKLPAMLKLGSDLDSNITTVDDLVALGQTLPPLSPLNWDEGQGRTKVAYLCSTSGTSGRQVRAHLYDKCIEGLCHMLNH